MPQNENRLWSRMRKGSGHYDEFIVLSPTTIIMHPIFTQGYTGDGVPKPGDMIAMGASPGLSWSVRSVDPKYGPVLSLQFGGGAPWGHHERGTVMVGMGTWSQIN